MSTVLMVVTALSLGIAAFASTIAWRVVRTERRRSEARVGRLAVAIGADATDPVESVEPIESEGADGAAFPFATAAGVSAVVVAAMVVAVSLFSADRGTPHASAAVAVAAPKETPAAGIEQPLELLALSHDRSRAAFTVRGIVRNPGDSPSRSAVTAFVQLYDGRGGLIMSGRAPVASTALLAGAESTFVIVVPGAPDVERYRVSFRAADNVIPHVDRRPGA